MAIIDIGICNGENSLLGIGIESVGIFLYWWNPNYTYYKEKYASVFIKPVIREGRLKLYTALFA